MESALLETKLHELAQEAAKALREYSGEPMYCDIVVFTRNDKDGEDVDTYSITAAPSLPEEPDFRVKDSVEIKRAEDGGILRTKSFYKRDGVS